MSTTQPAIVNVDVKRPVYEALHMHSSCQVLIYPAVTRTKVTLDRGQSPLDRLKVIAIDVPDRETVSADDQRIAKLLTDIKAILGSEPNYLANANAF